MLQTITDPFPQIIPTRTKIQSLASALNIFKSHNYKMLDQKVSLSAGSYFISLFLNRTDYKYLGLTGSLSFLETFEV